MIRLAALLLCLCGAVQAQVHGATPPALYAVTGVASDDVLNIRSEPSAEAEIIDSFTPDANDIEVVELSGNWARVNTGEGSGWASLSYLAAQPDGTFPQVATFQCFGTEPFWSLEITQNETASFRAPDGEMSMQSGAALPAAGRIGLYGLVLSAPHVQAALSLRQEACNDGMSDRNYALATEVIFSGQSTRVLSGCCSIAP